MTLRDIVKIVHRDGENRLRDDSRTVTFKQRYSVLNQLYLFLGG